MKKISLLVVMLLFLIGLRSAKAQWTPQTSGTASPLYSVSVVNDNVVWACGGAGTVIRTTNGGANWTNVSAAPVAGDLYNVYAMDQSTALVTNSGASATVWKTTNGGATWNQVFVQPGGFINVIDINSSGAGFMQGDPVGGRWSLWRTTDGGTNWDSTLAYLPQAGSEAGWNNSLYINGVNIWFGTNNSKVYYSSNGGLTWTSQSTPQTNTYTIWFNNTLSGVSGGTAGIRTINGGTNWTSTTIGGTGNVTGSAGYGTNFLMSQGTNIYRSTNNGASFTVDFTGSTQILDMGISRTGTRLWAVGSTGAIYTNDGVVSINNITTTTPDKYSLSQNFPNPFNPTTKINFDITKNDFVTLKVYNTVGQEVSNLVSKNLTARSYEVNFDVANLTSGIYFYTITAGDFVQTKKMMLVK